MSAHSSVYARDLISIEVARSLIYGYQIVVMVTNIKRGLTSLKMVDTKKHSSFPPLLGQYNTETKSKLEYTPRSYPATADIRSDLQRQQQVTNPIVSKPKTHRIQEPFCPRARRMKSTSNKKFEGKANLKQTEVLDPVIIFFE